METPGLGFPGPGAEALQAGRQGPHGGVQAMGALRTGFSGQISETLSIRQTFSLRGQMVNM